MIERILPAAVAVVESTVDIDGAPLFPEEEPAVAAATPRRRREFATTRACARGALAALGVPDTPVTRGAAGTPRWPEGLVGSLTHCTGYRAAAVGRSTDIAAVGIDGEPHRPLRDGLLDVIALPRERAHLATLRGAAPTVCWDRLLFSAKESVFKAWYPMTGHWLDFGDALLTFRPRLGSFRIRLRVPGPAGFTGRWLVEDGLVLTTVLLPVDHDSSTAPPLSAWPPRTPGSGTHHRGSRPAGPGGVT